MLKMEIVFTGDLVPLVRTGRRPWPVVRSGAGERASVRLELAGPAALKDVVESLGVPHCEIGVVTGDLTRLEDPVADGFRVAVGPAPPRILADPRFLCDGHLGRLARLLHMTGFDTLHDPAWTEAELARRGTNQGRTVLSRHRALLKRRSLKRAMLVRSDDPFLQLGEVLVRYRLADRAQLFARCSACNGCLVPVARADVADRIPPRTSAWLDEYSICSGCGKLYWLGTHALKIRPRLERLIDDCRRQVNGER
ncbi:Mut7-C ubiquitin/RNAse domain-containing protein [bacterium]|nr:Mut7-C ubiquitin/RNAse domain-containing protein [bacterium]